MFEYYEEIKDIIETAQRLNKTDGIATRLSKNEVLWQEILEYTNDFEFINKSERIYFYYHKHTEKAKCKCGNLVAFRTFNSGYAEFCKFKCEYYTKAGREKAVKTMIQQGGVGLANPITREKAKSTLQKKYGENIINPGQLPSHIEYMQGPNSPMKRPEVINKFRKEKNYSTKHITPENYIKLENKDWLLNEFSNNSRSVRSLSEELGVHDTTIIRRLNGFGIREPREWIPEKQIHDFLKTLVNESEIIRNSKSIIPNQLQLDFYLPNYKIAIEHCGFYWHGDSNETSHTYHRNKFKLCSDLGIRLFTIFEDEWLEHSDICKSILRHALNKTERRIFGNDTVIEEISHKNGSDFYDRYHIQGGKNISTSINLGAFTKDTKELIAVMSFKQYGETYELARYASAGLSYIGGASKLLKYFQKEYNPNKIFTFADLRWSIGILYEKLGFESVGLVPPTYYYTKDQKRYHKRNFQKSKLDIQKDSNITEHQFMLDSGYDRIYDCGKIKYEWTKI